MHISSGDVGTNGKGRKRKSSPSTAGCLSSLSLFNCPAPLSHHSNRTPPNSHVKGCCSDSSHLHTRRLASEPQPSDITKPQSCTSISFISFTNHPINLPRVTPAWVSFHRIQGGCSSEPFPCSWHNAFCALQGSGRVLPRTVCKEGSEKKAVLIFRDSWSFQFPIEEVRSRIVDACSVEECKIDDPGCDPARGDASTHTPHIQTDGCSYSTILLRGCVRPKRRHGSAIIPLQLPMRPEIGALRTRTAATTGP